MICIPIIPAIAFLVESGAKIGSGNKTNIYDNAYSICTDPKTLEYYDDNWK